MIAVPISIGIALFVTEVAPRRFRKPIVYMVDLLAAIPSVVFGLWALRRAHRARWPTSTRASHDATSGIPLLSDLTADPSPTGLSFMTAGLIVAIMITPIITSLTREMFATTPAGAEGGGATASARRAGR